MQIPKTVFVTCVILYSLSNTFGQCLIKSTKFDSNLFNTISNDETKTDLIKKYKEFINFYCKNNFDEIYKMLSKNYLKSINKDSSSEFVSYKNEYYSENKVKFISFVPTEIIETYNSQGVSSLWTMRGCLTQIIRDKEKRRYATLDIWKQSDDLFFSDISLVKLSLAGETQGCKK